MSGALGLMGGGEYLPGCEEFDAELLRLSGAREIHLLPTAAARHSPAAAVATATRYFHRLGHTVTAVPLLKRTDAGADKVADMLAGARLIHLCGGDPGHLLSTLHGTRAWAVIQKAWGEGATLAGSSAGAMVLASQILLMARWPNHTRRRWTAALGLVENSVVLPHFADAGRRWLEPARESEPPGISYICLEERSGIIWDGSGWLAAGPRSSWVISGTRDREYPPGDTVDLGPPGAASPHN